MAADSPSVDDQRPAVPVCTVWPSQNVIYGSAERNSFNARPMLCHVAQLPCKLPVLASNVAILSAGSIHDSGCCGRYDGLAVSADPPPEELSARAVHGSASSSWRALVAPPQQAQRTQPAAGRMKKQYPPGRAEPNTVIPTSKLLCMQRVRRSRAVRTPQQRTGRYTASELPT